MAFHEDAPGLGDDVPAPEGVLELAAEVFHRDVHGGADEEFDAWAANSDDSSSSGLANAPGRRE